NVTAIAPSATGFAVVYPCGTDVPLASTIDFTAGAIVPNSAIVKIGAGGAICVFSNVDTDLVLDVNGYEDATAVVQLFEPMRVLETRPGVTTADHLFESGGLRPSDTVLQLQIGNRLGIPTAIRAAVLNITVTEATGAGFLTVYPCGTSRPLASTLNYEKGATVANLAVATTSSDGKVCIYTQTATQLVVDLSGYHT
ncbi:MAG: HYR domain-containing protein, partial [Ilumatobacteraceae bacterium]